MKILYLVLSVLFLCNTAFADAYLMYDKSNNDVIDLSPRNDAVVNDGWEKIVVEGEIKDYALEHPLRYYKYIDKRFVLNVQKMSDEAAVEAKQKARSEELLSIDKKMKLLAKKELEKEGVVFKEVKDDDFK